MMKMKPSPLLALIHARNKEFIRDRSALGWSLIFPLILIVALAMVFDNDDAPMFRIGVVGNPANAELIADLDYINWIRYDDEAQAEQRIARHRIDLLLNERGYAINPDNRSGYFLEQLLLAKDPNQQRLVIAGRSMSHVEWYLPGILSMNMMFSALFGVGYVLIRYRRTGVLRRMQVTPLTSGQFLLSQLLSRLMAIMATAIVVFTVVALLFDVRIQGNILLLILSSALGTAAMISIGLLVACRTRSDELGNGVLNMLSWPMMLLSGIWFSMEGSSPWLKAIANLLPLSHMNAANRAIISDGAGFTDVLPQLAGLGSVTLICFGLAAYCFKWD